MEDQIFIQHKFTIIADDGTRFDDAIVLPKADYEALSDKDIENIKRERLENWQTVRTTPPPEVDPQAEVERIAAEKQYAEALVIQKTDELEIATANIEAVDEVPAEVTTKGK